MTTAVDPAEVLDPVRVLLARMLRSTEEAREICDRCLPNEFVDRLERHLFNYVGQMLSSGLEISPKGVYRAAAQNAPSLIEVIVEFGRLSVSDTIAKDAQVVPLADAIAIFKRQAYADRLKAIYDEAVTGLDYIDPERIESMVEFKTQQLHSENVESVGHDDANEQLKEAKDHILSDRPNGLTFGFNGLDHATVPMLDGNLILVGGAMGSGKSSFARNVLRAVIRNNPQLKAALHSHEMSALEQWINLACMDSGVDTERAFQSHLLNEDEENALGQALVWWKQQNRLIINERSGVTPRQLMQTIRRYHHEGVRFHVIDHLHEIEFPPQADLRIEIGRLTQELKAFAKNNHSIIMALVQLTKMDKSVEPNDGNIRESAKIGEEADKILFVFRPLIAHKRGLNGILIPETKGMMPGGPPIFEKEVTKKMISNGVVLSHDDERVYVKLGKQRIRPRQGVVAIRYDAPSGLMYDRERRKDE